MKSLRWLSVRSAVVLSLAGCNGGGASDPSFPAPALVPTESIDIGLSFFRNRTPGPGTGSTVSWDLALDRIAFVDGTVGPLLAHSLAALRAASTRSPEASSGMWRWPLTAVEQGIPYTGFVTNTGFNGPAYFWQIVVTAPQHIPPLNGFVLAEGHYNSFGTGGAWVFYDASTATHQVVASLLWNVNALAASRGIRVQSDGGLWTYEETGPLRYLDFLTGDVAPRFTMWWNVETGTGTIAAAQGNGCWDAQLHDFNCG